MIKISRKEKLKELLVDGGFHNEGNIEERRKVYEDKSNPFDKFFSENVVEDGNSFIFKFEFRKCLDQWCKENGFRVMSDKTIFKFMKDKDVVDGRRQADWFTNEGNKPFLRCWDGIRWEQKENVEVGV